ncbi:hypothetical protein ACE4RR_10655 [Alteribacillus sp. HJP-4]
MKTNNPEVYSEDDINQLTEKELNEQDWWEQDSLSVVEATTGSTEKEDINYLMQYTFEAHAERDAQKQKW